MTFEQLIRQIFKQRGFEDWKVDVAVGISKKLMPGDNEQEIPAGMEEKFRAEVIALFEKLDQEGKPNELN